MASADQVNAYHLGDAQYAAIIEAAHQASSDMKTLYRNVDVHIDALVGANISTSGTRMGNKITEWNNDFNTVIQQLDALNADATAARDIARRTSGNAEQTAG